METIDGGLTNPPNDKPELIRTYIHPGPISNMGSNAREVVRVFACSTQLSYNLSMERYALMLGALRKAALGVGAEVEDFKNVFRYFCYFLTFQKLLFLASLVQYGTTSGNKFFNSR